MADFFKDLKLNNRTFDRQVSDREYTDLTSTPGGDLRTVTGRENLAQAIINRLLTRKGELTALGHPSYGSRLYQLVGEVNNTRIRGLAEIYIREALAGERRIQEVTAISFAPPVRGLDRDTLKIEIRVKPIGDGQELAIAIPIAV